MKFEESTISAFVDELASDLPSPGGGSVAALCGALAVGLSEMVGSLTIGKERFRDKWRVMEQLKKEGEELRREFIDLMDEDRESFSQFMAALKLPKSNPAEIIARKKAMSEGAKAATDVPLRTLETCVRVAELAMKTAENGNPKAASDAGCAAILADAAAKAASYNVRVNLPNIRDEEFAASVRLRVAKALSETEYLANKVAVKMNEFF